MNTIIIEHADNSTTALFATLATKLGLPVKAKAEKTEKGVITNPQIIKAINEYESGLSKGKSYTIKELKATFDKMLSNA